MDELIELDYLLNNIQDLEGSLYCQELNYLRQGIIFKVNLHQLDQSGFNSSYLSHYQGLFELLGNIYFKGKPPFLDRFLRDSVACFKPKFFSDDLFLIKVISKGYVLREKTCFPSYLGDLNFTLSELTYFLLNPEIEIYIQLKIKGHSRIVQESKEEIFNSSRYLNSLLTKSKAEKKLMTSSLLYSCSKEYYTLFVDGDYISNAQHLGIYEVIKLRYIWSLVWSGCFNSPQDLLQKAEEEYLLVSQCLNNYFIFLNSLSNHSKKSSLIKKIAFIWFALKKYRIK